MKMTKKKIILFVGLVLFVSLLAITYAWISHEANSSTIIEPGEFPVEVVASFKRKETTTVDGETTTTTRVLCEDASKDSKAYDSTRKVLKMNGSSVDDDELELYKVEDFYLSVTFTPIVSCRVRLKINDEWLKTVLYKATGQTKTESIERSGDILFPYVLNEDWFYDDKTNYVYYKGKFQKGTTPVTFSVIEGGRSTNTKNISTLKETIIVTATIEAQVVQANRYQEVWGINSYPAFTNAILVHFYQRRKEVTA
jgi:hypothetical protein